MKKHPVNPRTLIEGGTELISSYSDKKDQRHHRVKDIPAVVRTLVKNNPTIVKIIDFFTMEVVYEKSKPVTTNTPKDIANELF
jgi:hypothetical protein